MGWLLCIVTSFGFSQEVNERIIFASARGHVDSVDLYLQEDSVNLDYRYPARGYTALDYAMERNQRAAFAKLIDYLDRLETGPDQLMSRVMAGDSSGVARLLKEGADPNRRHASGYYPLSVAVRWGFSGIARALLSHGAKPNVVNRCRYATTPLIEASRDGNVMLGQLLVDQGADIQTLDINNDPALHWAVYFGHKDFVEWLLKNGARTDLVGKDSGDNALAIARRQQFKEIESLILKYSKQ